MIYNEEINQFQLTPEEIVEFLKQQTACLKCGELALIRTYPYCPSCWNEVEDEEFEFLTGMVFEEVEEEQEEKPTKKRNKKKK